MEAAGIDDISQTIVDRSSSKTSRAESGEKHHEANLRARSNRKNETRGEKGTIDTASSELPWERTFTTKEPVMIYTTCIPE